MFKECLNVGKACLGHLSTFFVGAIAATTILEKNYYGPREEESDQAYRTLQSKRDELAEKHQGLKRDYQQLTECIQYARQVVEKQQGRY